MMLFLSSAWPSHAEAQPANTITTVAGTGWGGFGGDGGPATASWLYYPKGIAIDSSGNIFIADSGNNRIRKVSSSTGAISTVAGTGGAVYNGDNRLATTATLFSPSDVAVDGAGNLYIADTQNHRVRNVNATTGMITTVAGLSTSGYSGDGGPATAAMLDYPYGVALDGVGNLYIAEFSNHRVRRVSAATGVITTVAGTGVDSFSGDGGLATAAGLSHPAGVALDPDGNLYITDSGNYRVRRVDAVTGVITTFAGGGSTFPGDGGLATSAKLNMPAKVALDGAGNLYISGIGNYCRVRKVTASTGVITTVAGR
jgi:sugar lactone lactonase YvrE